jgi:hyaluronoglucosaminidase
VRVRGLIEGFYGPPWSHAERLEMIRFCGRVGLNTWVHAPKDDPYHRARWREHYPDAELAQLAELVQEARRSAVEVAYAIAPGLDLCYSSEEELETIEAKCDQLRSIGIDTFQLLWDDIEHTLAHPEDAQRFGAAERPSGAAQCYFSNLFRERVTQPGPLVVCPMGYAGTENTPYRRSFSTDLHPAIVVYWTGPEVVSFGISFEAFEAAVSRFHGHSLLIWDNYPVNDFAREQPLLFLGPLRGRDSRLGHGRCEGIVANGMVEAAPSKLALATVADWARDPGSYDPVASFERALREAGSEVLEAARALGGSSVAVRPPADLAELVDALALGVEPATAVALLEPFV